jgi:hypothetical protein
VVSSRARSRAAATRSRMLTTPGWTRRDEDRYSHASRNSSFRESCSIARSNRNSSRSFQWGSSTCRSRGRRRSRAGDWYGSARGHRSRAARRPDPQLLRQPRHHGARDGGHVIRDVPQPWQRAQLHRRAQHVVPPRNLRTNVSSAGASVKYLISSARQARETAAAAPAHHLRTRPWSPPAPLPPKSRPRRRTPIRHGRSRAAKPGNPASRYAAVILIVVFALDGAASPYGCRYGCRRR